MNHATTAEYWVSLPEEVLSCASWDARRLKIMVTDETRAGAGFEPVAGARASHSTRRARCYDARQEHCVSGSTKRRNIWQRPSGQRSVS
jgi:hypothetical protein